VNDSTGDDRKEILKDVIGRLHEGADPEEVKERFKEALKGASSVEIAQAEEELINEGMPREEIQRLCKVHLEVFRESLESEKPLAPPGHPIHILMEEHKALLQFAGELEGIVEKLRGASSLDATSMEQLKDLEERFKESARHYEREENVLFPYLEKHGIKQPPAIMWMDHDQIRQTEKSLYRLVDERESMGFQEFALQLGQVASSLAELLMNHFAKENGVLFPASLKVMAEDEWRDTKQQFDELGYCTFTPESARMPLLGKEIRVVKPETQDRVAFEAGSLSREELEGMLDSLPVDITFVDKEDRVRYFNQSKDRLFPRAKAIIGRTVQLCHPQKSVHIVDRIVKGFRNGSRDVAEFWINLQGKLVHIRYLAVRDRNGEYVGTLEVTQDITDLNKLEGEKRLLDDTGP